MSLIKNSLEKIPIFPLEKIKVYAFVGPSGTGKSYRAQMVAASRGIEFIIDDGLLISGNELLARYFSQKSSNKNWNCKKRTFSRWNQEKRSARSFEKKKAKKYFNSWNIRWYGRKNC